MFMLVCVCVCVCVRARICYPRMGKGMIKETYRISGDITQEYTLIKSSQSDSHTPSLGSTKILWYK